MNFTSVELTEIYGGLLLLVIVGIIIMLFINDLIRKRMIFACNKTLRDKNRIAKVSVDMKTADYLKRNCKQELYRVDEFDLEKKMTLLDTVYV